jgi:immune inhibitor A
MSEKNLWEELEAIRDAARESDDGSRCAVAPSPELRDKIKQQLDAARAKKGSVLAPLVRAAEPRRPGFNDGLIVPPQEFPLGTPISAIRNVAAERAPLRGAIRVIVVLVDFSDKRMTLPASHFQDLFFSTGVIPTKSVREYYADVTHGLIDLQGQVVGPFRLPQTLANYAHGASGLGAVAPNAQTMARDALTLADPTVNFAPFDNDGNGFVDAFVVIHAGAAAEVTGSAGDIWSHKWVLPSGAVTVDGTKVFAYLTVPEDAKLGVCAHELGHLLFGFPDLYDTDGTSEGIGNWCLMAGGSWGGGGDTPTHPSAWCKINQGWASVDNRTVNSSVNIADVKTSHSVLRLWKDGAPGSEYFLVENRQQTGFDASLPASGLLIWHIDESVTSNTDESHYKVALMQADGKRHLELAANRGDKGDPFPGSTGNSSFTNTSTPNSRSYAGIDTCVAVTGISASAAVMTASVKVKCKAKEKDKEKEKERKEFIKEKEKKEFIKEKERKEFIKEKERKEFKEKDFKEFKDGKEFDKPFEGRSDGGFFDERAGARGEGAVDEIRRLEGRIAALEAAVAQGAGGTSSIADTGEPYIGAELRPDLSASALAGDEDYASLGEQMQQGSAGAKRLFDTKPSER